MFSRLLRRLRGDERGVAAIEFALWTTGFFFAIMVAVDFGGFYLARGQMNGAVGAAAISSFNDAESVDFAQLPTYVRGITGEPAMSVTTSCNGVAGSCTNFSRTCACLKTDGTYVAAACGNVCTGAGITAGSTAGYYLTIAASTPYEQMIIPNSALELTPIEQQATVRLQ